MNDAVAGLVGVFVGAFIAGGITYLMQRRREHREARGARLVVESELDEAAAAVRAIKDGKGWPPGWIQAWSDSWATYRPALALDMPDESFRKLAVAYLYMGRLETGLAAGRRGFVDTDQPFLQEVSESLEDARAVLRKRRRGWTEAG